MTKKDVVLISPPGRAYNHYRPPLALMYLAAYLEKVGLKTDIVDCVVWDQSSVLKIKEHKNLLVEEILEKVKKSGASIVGITCYTPEFSEVLDLAQKIKKQNPQSKIIVGGVHPSLYASDFFYRDSPVDYAVMGEGEVTLGELAKTLLSGKKPDKILGIVFARGDRMVKNAPRPLIENLDDLPFPAWNKVDMNYYTTPSPYAIRGVMASSFYILTSRGCPSQCTFCVAKKLREAAPTAKVFRCRSPKNIFREINELVNKYKVDSFYVIDDLFTIFPKNVIELCKLLYKNKMNLLWGCSTKVTTVTEEMIAWMAKAGCIQIDFGVERGSDKALTEVKKGITLAQIKKAFSFCQKYKIRTFANMLINVPGETEKDLDDELELLNDIKPTITSFNVFTPYLGTEIYEQTKLNLKREEYDLLGKPPIDLTHQDQKRFRFAKHKVDFEDFYKKYHRRYNPMLNSLTFYLSPAYLGHLARTPRKLQYLGSFKNLVRELIKQKLFV